MEKCSCYHEKIERHYLTEFERGVRFGQGLPAVKYENRTVGVCWGTMEQEVCDCEGDCTKCRYYPEKREQALKEKEVLNELTMYKKAYEHFCKNQNDLIAAIWGEGAWLIDTGNALDVNDELCRLIKQKYKVKEK